ncbi:MAG TPA: hypothetical protein GX399_05350 [Xanthomonadaceae bacterium]|nr:hypothetical protein [Xanthomonadaceae bacterium]
MRWRKLGVVWRPDGSLPWALSHATTPTPLQLSPEVVRVYLSIRDAENVGRVGYVDLDAHDLTRILRVAESPVLDVGEPGAFDESGVMATCVVPVDGRLYMYYVGFELGRRIRYRLLTGLAVSVNGGERFIRVRRTPVLERSSEELHIRGGPWVIAEQGRFRMWYAAGEGWREVAGKYEPTYELRYIESQDGMNWPERGTTVLAPGNGEHAFGRPYVLKTENGYKMHYSIRKTQFAAYRLGYAVSFDGLTWQRRDDDLGLDVGAPGDWDSQAIAYAAEFESADRVWLLYNGNDFGGTGFGLAVRED